MAPHRTERLSESLREELDELIAYEMSDPRVEAVSVTEVHVSPDLRHAQVMLRIQGDAAEQEEALDALASARHYLRRQLGDRLQLFRLPELHFAASLPATTGPRLRQILRRVRKGRPRE